jgi:hypothetical protein
MLVPLALHDSGVDTIAICSSFVFSLPNAASSPSTSELVDSIKAAADRVVRRWPLLAGIPVKDKKVRLRSLPFSTRLCSLSPREQRGVWSVDVPDDIEATTRQRALFTFSTTSLPDKAYHEAAGYSSPEIPFSASPSRELPFPAVPLFFPSSACNTTADHAKRQKPLLHVHVTVLSDSICLGIGLPHLFDGTGMGLVVKAIDAELHGREWDVPPSTWAVNPFVETLDRLAKDEKVEAEGKASDLPGFHGWVPGGFSAILRLLTGFLVERLWWRNELRWALLKKDDVAWLVKGVKEDVKRETGGEEYVSTSDILWSWIVKVRTIFSPFHSLPFRLIQIPSAVRAFCRVFVSRRRHRRPRRQHSLSSLRLRLSLQSLFRLPLLPLLPLPLQCRHAVRALYPSSPLLRPLFHTSFHPRPLLPPRSNRPSCFRRPPSRLEKPLHPLRPLPRLSPSAFFPPVALSEATRHPPPHLGSNDPRPCEPYVARRRWCRPPSRRLLPDGTFAAVSRSHGDAAEDIGGGLHAILDNASVEVEKFAGGGRQAGGAVERRNRPCRGRYRASCY